MDIISMQVPELSLPAIKSVLTFRPYLKYIEAQIPETKSTVYRQFLESIASLIKSSPELLEPIEDLSVLDRYTELIELIKITHLSQVKSDGMLYTLGLPSFRNQQINYFGYSDEFKHFFHQKGAQLVLKPDIANEEFQRNIYREILQKGYGIDNTGGTSEIMMHLVDESSSAKHFYKVVRRHHFLHLSTHTVLPELRQEWVDYASGVIALHEELKEPLPFDQFTMEGFFIFSILPDTEEMALTELSDAITQIHINDERITYEKMKQATLSLVGNEQVEIGFLPFLKVNDDYVYHNIFTSISLVFGRLKNHFSSEELTGIFHGLINKSCNCSTIVAALHNDVYRLDDDCTEQQHLLDILVHEGLSSLKFVPVWHKNELLGILEIGSSDPEAITVNVLRKLELAIPYFREYFMYKAAGFSEYMKSFIMQRYTAIQDSVSWKFNEQVWNALKKADKETLIVATPPVRFEDLSPYYGAIDFRNSSLKQTEAIHADYKTQLHFLQQLQTNNLLNGAGTAVTDFSNRVRYWCQLLEEAIPIDEEADLRHFLEVESLQIIQQFSKEGYLASSIANEYAAAVMNKDSPFHKAHNQYEASLQQLNRILREHLYTAELELQELVPHYFEKFQTDGLEYSLYAGSSINPGRSFPVNAQKTIVNWQLDTMLQMATAAYDNRNALTIPLETTQLILVHEHKVDISYRIDERHFDVEGSYSIRYEVIKKRIDKVHLLNSAERLTQPGTIAIVYTQRQGINPYLDKIAALTASGSLLPGVEYLDLEQLQGIGRLKAIRVRINFDNNIPAPEQATATLALKD